MTRRKRKKKGSLTSNELQERISKLYLKNPKKRYSAKQIIKKLRLNNSYDSVNSAMEKLAEKNFLYPISSGRYKLDKHMRVSKAASSFPTPIYIGKVDLTRSGAAYIVSEDSELDIYVAARNTHGAFDGDIVKVEVPQIPGKRKPEGRIVEIIERKTTHALGILKKYKRFAVVTHMGVENIPEVHLKLDQVEDIEENTPVVAEITDWGRGQNKAIWGKITKVMENASDND